MNGSAALTFFGALWKASWQIALLAGVVWAVCRMGHKAPARWRHALWLIVLVKLFVPPLAQFPSQLAFWDRAEPTPVHSAASVGATPSADAASTAAPPAPVRPADSPASTSSRFPAIGTPEAVALVWALGFCGMTSLLIRRLRRQAALMRRSNPAGAELTQALARNAESLGLRRLPQLRSCDCVGAGMLIGLIRPSIMLPTALAGCQECDLDAVLLHELAHVKRRDMAVVWLHQLAQMLFWFNPAVWLVGRELKRERELACDELVLADSGIARSDYASGYVSALKMANAAAPAPVSLAMAEPFEMERRRLEGILRRPVGRLTMRWAVALAVVAVIGIPTFAGLSHVRTSTVDFMLTKARSDSDSTWLKFSKVIKLRKPIMWSHGKLSIRVTAVGRGRSPRDQEPQTEKFVLFTTLRDPTVRWHLDGSSSAQAVFATGSAVSADGSSESYETGTGWRTMDLSFTMPPKGTRIVREVRGQLTLYSQEAARNYGPYTIAAAQKPVELRKGLLAVKVADWIVSDEEMAQALHLSLPNEGSLAGRLVVRVYATAQRNQPRRWTAVAYDASGRGERLESQWSDERLAKPSYVGQTKDIPTPSFGWRTEELTPTSKRASGASKGALVAEVSPSGPADKAGIRPGDVIKRVGDEAIVHSDFFFEGLAPRRVTLLRNRHEITVTVTPVEDPIWRGAWKAMSHGQAYPWPSLKVPAGVQYLGCSRVLFISADAVPVGFRPVKLVFHVEWAPVPMRKVPFTLRNIPIPPEFWK